MTQRVAILGGGVAGLSAAHELAERGFVVEVFESRATYGGKARSMGAPGTGAGGRRDLPGEHGFRFFPGFYAHLPDTMKRIPFEGKRHGTFDNLVPATQLMLAKQGQREATLVARFPTSLRELYDALKDLLDANIGIPDEELWFFAERLLVILTSCQERRLAEYEKIPWWDFIGAATRSAAYQQYLAEGLTRSLVAMKAELGSTRTVGDILIQLILNIATPGVAGDRVLDGPTSDVWIEPWRAHLVRLGVTFHPECKVTTLRCVGQRIQSVQVTDAAGVPREVTSDFFIAALPVEVMAPLITPEMVQADAKLAGISRLTWSWMSGIQFYLHEDVPLVNGHAIYVDTPWALTTISQRQFWDVDLSGFGDGTVKGVLSVDISDWETPGILYGKRAMDCTRSEIAEEVWAQLKRSLDVSPVGAGLTDANRAGSHLDPDIQFPNPHGTVNLEPLLINLADSWRFRPEARTEIKNLLLASDYVRTFTDLATMEGANEAARRAVNAILDAVASRERRCELWPLHEPLIFAPARAIDLVRFNAGLPHGGVAAMLAAAAVA
jgi:15-cis-phytoene desaturase